MENKGWIKIWRHLLDKPVWLQSTPEQKVILFVLLIMVNNKKSTWVYNNKLCTVLPGQVLTSINTILSKCGKRVSVQNIRTSLVFFKKCEILTYETTKMGTLVTISNWRKYQHEKEGN